MHKAWWSLGEVPYCFSRSSVKFQGHTAEKIVDLDPNWEFPDCNSSLYSPMATKLCTKLKVALKRCPIVFQVHLSNFKVKKLSTLTRTECFQTVTPVWIHWWIWNDAQSLIWYRRGALLFLGSSIKFQGHTSWKIDDLNPIWVRLLSRLQLSNPSDLPCLK